MVLGHHISSVTSFVGSDGRGSGQAAVLTICTDWNNDAGLQMVELCYDE